MNCDTIVLDGSCSLVNYLDGSCSLNNYLDGVTDKVLKVYSDEYYTGSYSVTPADEAIVLNTEQLKMSDNLTIEAIPAEYGRLSWNGSSLRVY